MARHLLLRHFSYIAASGYAAEGLYVLRGLVAAFVLGPALFGVWSAIRLVLMFSAFTDAGSNAAMVQCAPRAEGAGAPRQADAHRRVASAVTMAGALTAAAVVASCYGLWAPDDGPWHAGWLVALLIMGQQLLTLYQDTLASRRQFGWIAVTEIASAALSTVACIIGALLMGLTGFLLGLAGAYLLVLLVCTRIGPGFPTPAWRWRHAFRLLHVGWPIVFGQLFLVLLWNVDKLMLWLLRSSEELGVYALQSYFAVMMMILPTAVSEVILPHLRLRLGQKSVATTARPFLVEGTQWMAYVALPVVGLAFLLLHLPLRWFLNDYVAAIAPGRVLMLTSYFSIVAALAGTVLIATSHHGSLVAIRAVSVGVSAGAALAVLLAGGDLVGLAVAVSVGFLLHASLMMTLALRVVGVSMAEAFAWLAEIVIPYVGLMLVLVMLLRWIPDAPADPMTDLMRTAARCGILLLLLSPMALYAWRSRGAGQVGVTRQGS